MSTRRRFAWLSLPAMVMAALTAATFAEESAAPNEEAVASEEPVGLLLTWQQDPTTTMTIDWHTEPDDEAEPVLRYKPAGEDDWQELEAEQHAFPFSDRAIHRVELTTLEPATSYRFRVGEFERKYRFRTMPTDILEEPIVFAAGGDTRHEQDWMERTNRVAMEYDLDFVVWGGDLAYADGRPDRLYRWEEWFAANMNSLIDEDGRAVPVLVGTGNHEVIGGYYYNNREYEQSDDGRRRVAPYFYALFAFPGQPGYAALDFGDYLTLISLDTDHTNPIAGEQTDWLEDVLAKRQRQRVPHVFPFYHVPAYPSHRRLIAPVQTRVRETWVPLFEQYGIRVAFENHDHTYKRTHPIRDGEIHPDGVVYIGDGAWGVRTRVGHRRNDWYISRFASERHAIIVTLHGSHQHFLTVNENGDVIDEYPRTPRR